MSAYEDRMLPGFSSLPPGPTWDGHDDAPAWATGSAGCGCASCEVNRGSARHFGADGGRHHRPYPGYATSWDGSRDDGDWVPDLPDAGGNPYEVLRQLNDARHDPLTAYEEARAAAAAELAYPDTRDGRDLDLELSRYRNPDGGNISGSAAREIVRLTEFRALS